MLKYLEDDKNKVILMESHRYENHDVVLCNWINNYHPFVVWDVYEHGSERGEYFHDYDKAFKRFIERS